MVYLNNSAAFDRQLIQGLLGFINGELCCFYDADVISGDEFLFGVGPDGSSRYASVKEFLEANPNYRHI